MNGKVYVEVAAYNKKCRVPVISIIGSIGEGSEIVYDRGIKGLVNIANKPLILKELWSKASN